MTGRAGQVRWSLLIGTAIGVAVTGAIIIVLRTDTTGESGSGLGEEYTYDLAPMRKTDPKWVQYREITRFPTEMAEPRAVAVDTQDRVYVAGDKAIRVFKADQEGLAEFRHISLGRSPYCLAIAADGTLYVGMSDHVEVYDPKGERKAVWPSLGEGAVLTSIAVADEDVFVADQGNRIVVRFDTHGTLVGRIGRGRGLKGPGFVVPSPYFDLAVGRDGLLWVANPGRQRLEAYTFAGDFESSWGKPSPQIEGFCGCCNPSNFAFLPDGRFVTTEKGLPRVKVHKADGTFECVVAGPEQFVEGTVGLDVAVDSQGRILVLDPPRKAVRAFARLEKR